MCEPFSLIGGTLAAIGAITNTAIEYQYAAANQQALNNAIEVKYNTDLENARRAYAFQDFQNVEKRRVDQMTNEQERRKSWKEMMQMQSTKEAAMSALNITGTSAGRMQSVFGIQETDLTGAFDTEGERVDTQYMIDTYGAKNNYDNAVASAKANAWASWRPMQSTGLFNSALNIVGSTVGGIGSGYQFGQSEIGKEILNRSKNWFKMPSNYLPTTRGYMVGI